MTLTKAQLAKQVQQAHGNLSRREAQAAVDAVWNTIKQALAQGRSIHLKGFGRFMLRSSSARLGRNMTTGQAVSISARRVVVFRPGNMLKELVLEK